MSRRLDIEILILRKPLSLLSELMLVGDCMEVHWTTVYLYALCDNNFRFTKNILDRRPGILFFILFTYVHRGIDDK